MHARTQIHHNTVASIIAHSNVAAAAAAAKSPNQIDKPKGASVGNRKILAILYRREPETTRL